MRAIPFASSDGSSSSGTADDTETRRIGKKKNYRARSFFQSASFLALTLGYLLYDGIVAGGWSASERFDEQDTSRQLRELQSEGGLPSCDSLPVSDPAWLCVFYAIGVLYMFLALAIVCDEFFVPALEEMSGPRRLNLSMDVAGATLMAAGGSAPELFSSLFGTFSETAIGIGTIIGSAVFNVLFVIAMCTLFAKEVLTLTWWPLFRDSFCYAIGLIVLAVFLGVVSPGRIDLWEGIVLFVMYFFYIAVMWRNRRLYKLLTGKVLELPDDEDDEDKLEKAESSGGAEDKNTADTYINESGHIQDEDEENPERPQDDNINTAPRPTIGDKASSAGSIASAVNLAALQAGLNPDAHYDFRWQGTFRAGILKLLRHPHCWITTAGVGIVAKIAGDADVVFNEIDANGDGSIDREELRRLFDMLECRISDAELDEVFKQLDADGNGVICKAEFNKWYTTSVELIRSQVRQVFDELDADNSGTLDKYEVKALLLQLDPSVTDDDVQQALEAMYKEGSRDEITFDEFEEWYEKSMIYERQKQAVEEDMEGVFENLKPPFGEGFFSWMQYILVFPIVLVLVFTIPDVRRPGWGRLCYLAFIIAIAWIGGFSYLMVSWAEIIGNTIGIPPVIMGLTVLAAGTSVPDLLSSVIVARRGQGDMAVSSSIGSNIFDILVGLPVPWIIFTAWTGRSVVIETNNIWISICVLLGMLVFVIAAIHCQGWKLTKTLGAMMMVFYVLFLVQAILLERDSLGCTP